LEWNEDGGIREKNKMERWARISPLTPFFLVAILILDEGAREKMSLNKITNADTNNAPQNGFCYRFSQDKLEKTCLRTPLT
jgi:hypothetical protein